MAAAAKPKPLDPLIARDDLLKQLEQKREDLKENTLYYESTRRPKAIGIAVPPEMRELLAQIGYPRLFLDAISDRLEIEGFLIAGADSADEKLWDWFQANDLDVESVLGFTESMIHGRSYITVAAPDVALDPDADPEVPIIRVEDPLTLHAVIDPRTRKVTQAVRATYSDDQSTVTAATVYLPEGTFFYEKVEGQWQELPAVKHALGIVPVVPMPNRTRLSDLYGTSAITPELRSVTDAAARVLMLMQATAELMGVPLRVLFGVKKSELGIVDEDDEEAPNNPRAAFEAYYARILAFEDEHGTATQFSAAELRNFTDAIDALDKKAAAYTGLPPQYLSTQSDTPASAEAIKASEARLIKTCERKAKIFGAAWEQAMRVATRVMGEEVPPAMLRMETIWRDPATPTYAAKADAATKMYAGGLGVIPKEQARIDMGYSVEQRLRMKEWDAEENPAGQLAGMYSGPPKPVAPSGPPAATPAADTQDAAA